MRCRALPPVCLPDTQAAAADVRFSPTGSGKAREYSASAGFRPKHDAQGMRGVKIRVNPYHQRMNSPSTPENQTPAAPQEREVVPQWVPALHLDASHKQAIEEHLLRLGPDDRYLRFGYAASDEQIARYVAHIGFGSDAVFGVLNRRLELVAMAHLAHAATGPGLEAEFGVSVSAHLRGKGFGTRLFQHAVLMARNQGVQWLRIHALSENRAMLHIAMRAGATVERCGPEAEALLRLPSADVASRWEAWLESSAAQIDYSVKQQAQRLEKVRSAIVGHK
jgi:GNAT superfamily N-acetyltransferase